MALTPVVAGKPVTDYVTDESALVLVRMMERVLERVVAVYESHGVPLPARKYWMMGGDPPEDCEQLVVNFLQSYLGAPGDQAQDAQMCNQPRTAVINVNVTRNHPVGEAGKAVATDRIMQASGWPAVDVAVLLWSLEEISALEDFIRGPGIVATVNVMPVSGGVQTTVLNLSMIIS